MPSDGPPSDSRRCTERPRAAYTGKDDFVAALEPVLELTKPIPHLGPIPFGGTRATYSSAPSTSDRRRVTVATIFEGSRPPLLQLPPDRHTGTAATKLHDERDILDRTADSLTEDRG